MKRALRWLAAVIALLLLVPGVLWGIGTRLPREHTATVEVRLDAPLDEVWLVVRDLEGGASWRDGVSAVRRLPDRDGLATYEEENAFGPLTYVVTEEAPPTRLVTRVVDETAFGGTWTYLLTPTHDHGTLLRVTEDGEIDAPLSRCLARYVFGYDGTLRSYTDSLARRFSR